MFRHVFLASAGLTLATAALADPTPVEQPPIGATIDFNHAPGGAALPSGSHVTTTWASQGVIFSILVNGTRDDDGPLLSNESWDGPAGNKLYNLHRDLVNEPTDDWGLPVGDTLRISFINGAKDIHLDAIGFGGAKVTAYNLAGEAMNPAGFGYCYPDSFCSEKAISYIDVSAFYSTWPDGIVGLFGLTFTSLSTSGNADMAGTDTSAYSAAGGVNWSSFGSGGRIVGSFGTPVGTVPSAAPEPASWALMIGGFGMIGAGMRRRARRAIAA